MTFSMTPAGALAAAANGNINCSNPSPHTAGLPAEGVIQRVDMVLSFVSAGRHYTRFLMLSSE